MTTLPTTFTFARSGNPAIIPPAGPVALGSQLDSNFAACAPLINEVNYPTNSVAGIALAQIAINNGAAAATDQVVAGFGLAGGGAIGINPVVSAGPELAGVAGLGVTDSIGLVNRSGPGTYNAVTLEAGTGISLTTGPNSITINNTGSETVPSVIQTIMGGTSESSQLAGTFPAPLTSGNYLIALWSSYTGSYEFNTTDWTLLTSQGEAADNLIVTYHLIADGDAQSIIVATLPASTGMFACFEVQGLLAPPTIDVSSLTQTNGTTSHTASAGPTTATDLALVMSFSTATSVGISPDSSWTVDKTIANASGRDGWAGHKLYPDTGSTVSETTTFLTSTTNEVILVALKYVGGGGGGGTSYIAGSGPPTAYQPQGTVYTDLTTGFLYESNPIFVPGTAAPTIVQSAIGQAGPKPGSTVTPLTATLPASPVSGNLLVAIVANGASPYASQVPPGWTAAQGANSGGLNVTVLYKYVASGETATQTLQTDVTYEVAFGYIWEVHGANPSWASAVQYIFTPNPAADFTNSLPQPPGTTTSAVNSLGLSFSTSYNVSGSPNAAVPDSTWTNDYDDFSIINSHNTSNIAGHKVWATSGSLIQNNTSLVGVFETFQYGYAIVVLNSYGTGSYTPRWEFIGPVTVKAAGTAIDSQLKSINFNTNLTATTDGNGNISVNASGGGGGSTPVTLTTPDLIYCWDSAAMGLKASSGYTLASMSNICPWNTGYSYLPKGSALGAQIGSSTLSGYPVITSAASTNSRYVANSGVAPYLHKATLFAVVNLSDFSNSPDIVCGSNGSLEFRIGSGGTVTFNKTYTTNIGNSSGTFATNTWVQINATYDDSTGNFAFRIAKTAAGSGTNAQSITAPSNTLFYNDPSNGGDFNGSIAFLAFYSRVLSPTEITDIENYLTSTFGV